MAQMQKLEGEVEMKCSAEKVIEMFARKQHNIPNVCSIVSGIEAHQSDRANVGTTRKWTCVIDGKSEELVEKMEEVDVEKKMIRWTVIDRGVTMNNQYKMMATKLQATPIKGRGDSCMVKVTIEYEKLYEDAPEPHQLFNFIVNMLNQIAPHLA